MQSCFCTRFCPGLAGQYILRSFTGVAFKKMSRNSSKKSTTEIYDLAKALSDQPWDSIGSVDRLTHSSKSKEELEDQLISLLCMRLDVLHASRKYASRSLPIIISDLRSGLITSGTISTNPEVYDELTDYVSMIDSLYNDVPYHSFYHAAQVTISMNKLISMLVNEEESKGYVCTSRATRRTSYNDVNMMNAKNTNAKDRFTATLGIGKDPMAHFALLFSGLIHDAGHKGISNMQLSKESDELSLLYNDQSTAEQNSLSMAFLLLYDKKKYSNLLHYIAPTIEDRRRFRHLVINTVMCSDIASPDRTQLAKSKWKEAFEIQRQEFPTTSTTLSKREQLRNFHSGSFACITSNRPIPFGIRRALHLSGQSIDFYTDSEIELKSSTVLEQMMAVADISHIFQSYETLLIWNEKLFHELIVADVQGRGFDPCGFWFEGQIGFIDNYVIPLADRLSLCNLFGENSFLFLKNAKEIRRRWIVSGHQFCEELIDKYVVLYEEK